MPPNAENGCCEVLAAAKNGELGLPGRFWSTARFQKQQGL